MTPFDQAFYPKEMQMLKIFLPFLPAPMQKLMAIYIKWTELKYTIDYFNRNPPMQKPVEIGDLMSCMKELLPPQEQAQMEQFADIFENMDLYREMFEGFSAAASPEKEEESL